MSLTPPKLDDRDFDSLFQEARSRIPRYLPEWTDWNESDPGITLLQLHAWLTETILYRLNQVPELNYIKFLQLLGVKQKAARPAQADLTFTLKDSVSKEKAEVTIEKGTIVGVSDADLEEPLSFETERTLIAISARLQGLIRELPTNDTENKIVDVTQANQVDGQTFTPFSVGEDEGENAIAGTRLYLAFSSPLPFSREEIGLQVYLAEEGQGLLAASGESVSGPDIDEDDLPELAWQWWDGTAWSDLDVTADETRSLTESGQVYFRVPGQIPAVPAHTATSLPTQAPPQLQEVAGLTSAVLASLQTAQPPINTVAALAALSADDLIEILGFDPENEAAVESANVLLENAGRLLESPLYYWLRIVFHGGTYAKAPVLDRILTNTVRATAALTVFDEAVGSSDGKPNQVMILRNKPVLPEPPLQLEVDEGTGPQLWHEVPDFFGAGPDDPYYVLDRATGQITFGDGKRGRIPVAGQFNAIARQYRYGGGQVGNVGANTITDLTSPIADVDAVANSRPATGGADEESLSDTKLRAARQMKARNRAVTLEDFAELARETPGAQVARAAAYRTDSSGVGHQIDVAIVPQSEAAKPVPSEATRRLVRCYLDERRLVTTQLRVSGPQYCDVDVVMEVFAQDDADLRSVKTAIAARLADYLHPLRGSIDGKGWPFGYDMHYSEVLREIMAIAGVLRVDKLKFRKFEQELDEGEGGNLVEDDTADFPNTFNPIQRKLRVVEPGIAPDAPPQEKYYAITVYHCTDLPVAAGALVALRQAEISVRYLRRT